LAVVYKFERPKNLLCVTNRYCIEVSGVARVFAARGGLKNAALIFAVKIFEALNSETVIKL